MQINVLLFASLRDAAGGDVIEIEVPEFATAADVLSELKDRVPESATLLSSCRVALDCRYVSNATSIAGAKEIAIIPPVSGG